MSSVFGRDPDYGSVFTRMMIRLLPGEEPPKSTLWGHDPPEGYRWESDAELRARIDLALGTARTCMHCGQDSAAHAKLNHVFRSKEKP